MGDPAPSDPFVTSFDLNLEQLEHCRFAGDFDVVGTGQERYDAITDVVDHAVYDVGCIDWDEVLGGGSPDTPWYANRKRNYHR